MIGHSQAESKANVLYRFSSSVHPYMWGVCEQRLTHNVLQKLPLRQLLLILVWSCV